VHHEGQSTRAGLCSKSFAASKVTHQLTKAIRILELGFDGMLHTTVADARNTARVAMRSEPVGATSLQRALRCHVQHCFMSWCTLCSIGSWALISLAAATWRSGASGPECDREPHEERFDS
jgi:hypothetical protein